MSKSTLFVQLPIGALFYRDPFDDKEGLSVKVDSDHARTPKGEIVPVHPHVLVFYGFNNEVEFESLEDIEDALNAEIENDCQWLECGDD